MACHRPYEIVRVGEGWMLRTRPAYGAVIRAAADVRGREFDLSERDLAVLAAIAYHQPITAMTSGTSSDTRSRAI